VSTADPQEYNTSSEFAEQYPPGERTTYETKDESKLHSLRKVYIESIALEQLVISPVSQYEDVERTGVRFTIDRVKPSHNRSEEILATGEVRIDSTGLVRELDLGARFFPEVAISRITMMISDMGSTTVGDRPEWAAAEFDAVE
jgi:hypothetical protein